MPKLPHVPTNPQLDPFGKIPEYKFCVAKLEPAAVPVAAAGYDQFGAISMIPGK